MKKILSSLSVAWRWKDIGSCDKSGILSKLLGSFGLSTPLKPHLLLQPLFGTWGTPVQSELWMPGGSPRGAHESTFGFLFLLYVFAVWTQTQWNPPSLCPGRTLQWPMRAAPSEPATKWSLGVRLQLPWGMCRNRHQGLSSPTLNTSQPQRLRAGFWGVTYNTHLPWMPWVVCPKLRITYNWFLGHSDFIFKMLAHWWYPSM